MIIKANKKNEKGGQVMIEMLFVCIWISLLLFLFQIVQPYIFEVQESAYNGRDARLKLIEEK